MPQLTFPIVPDGFVVDILVNLEVSELLPRRASGQSCPPLAGKGVIDTGSNVSGVSPTLLRQLGVQSVGTTSTTGIGGSYPVRLYRVSLHISDLQNLGLSWFSHLALTVMDLPPWLAHEGLIGRDILLTCKTIVDGPGGFFTLDF
jgi:hypothetical protein